MSKHNHPGKGRNTQKGKPFGQVVASKEVKATSPPELSVPVQQNAALPKPRDRRFLGKVWTTLVKLRVAAVPMAMIAIVAFALDIRPDVRVILPADLADPLQPYNVSFSVQNSGKLPIYGVEVQCVPHTIQMRFRWSVTGKQPGPAMGNRRFVADEIGSQQSRSFVCDVIWMPPNPVLETNYAELGVLVRFRPFRFIPLNWPANGQVFVTSRQGDGRLRWEEYFPDLQKTDPKYPAR